MDNVKQVCTAGLMSVFLSTMPLVAAQPEVASPRGPVSFATYDQNADGAISEAEFNAVRTARQADNAAVGRPMPGASDAPGFEEFDSNGDGALTADELTRGQLRQKTQRNAMGRGAGQGPGSGRGPGMNQPAFGDYDLDASGGISEQEFNEARQARIGARAEQGYPMKNLGKAPAFADIDTDGNGSISAAEFTAHQQRLR